ncbi:pentapeptide repeat-containing protein [Streptomyces sp. NPDC048425]|uniref:pentapeptide repeat-containing protein n=1 Tax=Streptomyces sp. NPDC048425 TaxID=3365548 RepID=UPI00371D72D7
MLGALRDPGTGQPHLGGARFRSATFEGEAEFRSATFMDDAGFGAATFEGDAWFGAATFKGPVDLGPFVCAGRVSLAGAVFGGPMTLSRVARRVECREPVGCRRPNCGCATPRWSSPTLSSSTPSRLRVKPTPSVSPTARSWTSRQL